MTEAAPAGTVLLAQRDVYALLDLDSCIAAVDDAFRLHADGRAVPSRVLGVPFDGGGFHLKAAGLVLEEKWFAVKCNGNFFDNAARYGLPNIQGLVLLCDGSNGRPLAVIDSIAITILRTGAATAVAARHLARDDARVAAIVGCGGQGRAQVRAVSRVRPLEQVRAFDADAGVAQRFAREMGTALGIPVEVVTSPADAARRSDICITCTPSRSYFLRREDVRPGTFVAGVGADSETKQELDPELFRDARVVVDSLEQCATIGDLHHALAAGTIAPDGVHAELAELVSGRKAGRTSRDEITLFDSTGIALEDVATAVVLYQRALRTGAGMRLDFGK